MRRFRPTRRELLAVGAGAVISACGRTQLAGYEGGAEPVTPFSDWPPITVPEYPAASWEEDDDVAQQIGDPIILTAAATISSSADAAPNLAALTNPYGLPMELLEVRFSAYAVSTDATLGNSISGQDVGVKMDLGKIAVVNAGTPMSVFSNYRDAFNPSDMSYAINSSNLGFGVATYSWRLKYPLFVPGGTTLNVKFTNNSLLPVDVQVTVTYHCRVMPKSYRPKKLMVPWVSAYNSKAFTVVPNAAADSDTSTELDITNPFIGVPLEVSRLTGVFSSVQLGTGTINTLSEALNLDQPREYLFVTMRSSQGDELVFNNTPFECLWPGAWRAWDLPDGTALESGSWLKLQVLRPAITYDLSSLYTARVYYSVGMLGYREIGGREFNAAAEVG